MKIDLFWIAAIAELRFIKSLVETKTVRVTEVVEATVMILAFKKWLFEAVLDLTDAAPAAAAIWSWQCLSYYNFSSVSVKTWTCS